MVYLVLFQLPLWYNKSLCTLTVLFIMQLQPHAEVFCKGRIKIEYLSIPHYNFYRDYLYSSWQQVHMMVRVGREIRKITFPPSDNGILGKQWSFRAPCWWVNYKEETTGSNTPFCLCGCINYAAQTTIVKNYFL